MSKTLLIIDDDTLFCDAVAKFFHGNNFQVAITNSGEHGLKWCEKNGADVILLDQKLPDARGLDLCKPLLSSCIESKIIFITAYPSFDHAVQALRSRANDYLSKPMSLKSSTSQLNVPSALLSLNGSSRFSSFSLNRILAKTPLLA